MPVLSVIVLIVGHSGRSCVTIGYVHSPQILLGMANLVQTPNPIRLSEAESPRLDETVSSKAEKAFLITGFTAILCVARIHPVWLLA